MDKEGLIRELKDLCEECLTTNYEKDTINLFHDFDEDHIEYGCCNNYLKELDEYEVFMFVSSVNIVASNVAPFTTKNRQEATDKFNEYKELIIKKDILIIEDYIK